MTKPLYLSFIFTTILLITACSESSKNKPVVNENDLSVEKSEWVEMLVEIPAGTIKKFELNKKTGSIEIDSVNGKPRLIEYLGYPANYGMIPNTLLPLAKGGDGDPLDILAIGPVAKSGELVKCKIIGVLKLLDRGEQDDKLIAIGANSTLNNVENITDLVILYPGILEIIETWFSNYKGIDRIVSQGYRPKSDAVRILEGARISK